jgi:Ni,Fe-hydrogenase III large subunit
MKTLNCQPVAIDAIERLAPEKFRATVSKLLSSETSHCVAYFALPDNGGFTLFCGVADDKAHDIDIQATKLRSDDDMESLAVEHPSMAVFEREMHEQYGLKFVNHPWLKPLRYPADRCDTGSSYANYPFFTIESDELHEVGVGPVHAGIIEPGHFRFICEGEKVLHLEIVLGYQHRGIENMMKGAASLKQILLAESIAGDSTVAHTIAYIAAIEALAGHAPEPQLQLERCIALELERIAIHIGDTSALCMDVAYQLGQVACEALRTIVINTNLIWCGSRFARGLIRPAGAHFHLDRALCSRIRKNIREVERRYRDVAQKLLSLPSLLARFEDIGAVSRSQALRAGLTGLSARASGLERDVRLSQPFQYYSQMKHTVVVENSGDILARLKQRINETEQSVVLINRFIDTLELLSVADSRPDCKLALSPDKICISLVEGWRGEICNTVITDADGNIRLCKIKDPSLHNWTGLALAVRNQDISDFPICNKSFNLSYCGTDL